MPSDIVPVVFNSKKEIKASILATVEAGEFSIHDFINIANDLKEQQRIIDLQKKKLKEMESLILPDKLPLLVPVLKSVKYLYAEQQALPRGNDTFSNASWMFTFNENIYSFCFSVDDQGDTFGSDIKLDCEVFELNDSTKYNVNESKKEIFKKIHWKADSEKLNLADASGKCYSVEKLQAHYIDWEELQSHLKGQDEQTIKQICDFVLLSMPTEICSHWIEKSFMKTKSLKTFWPNGKTGDTDDEKDSEAEEKEDDEDEEAEDDQPDKNSDEAEESEKDDEVDEDE